MVLVCTNCGLVLGSDAIVDEYMAPSSTNINMPAEKEIEAAQKRFLAGGQLSTEMREALDLRTRDQDCPPEASYFEDDDDIARTALRKQQRNLGRASTAEDAFVRRHKIRMRRKKEIQFPRRRTGTKRYSTNYFDYIPRYCLISIGAGAGRPVEDINRAITNGQKKVELLLSHFANFDMKSNNGLDLKDWKLMYKLDAKVLSAVTALYVNVPPDPKYGYTNVTNNQTKLTSNGISEIYYEKMKSQGLIPSFLSIQRRCTLDNKMWKVYYFDFVL